MTRVLPETFSDGSLTIRRWRQSDRQKMRELIESSLDHLRPWMAWAANEPIDDARRAALVRRWDRYHASGAGAVYAVFDDGELVGGSALHRRVGPGGVDLGYWLGIHAAGRGLATRIVVVLTEAALEIDGVEFVQISHETRNVASGRVAERAGYQRVEHDMGDAITIWRRRRPDRER